MQQFSTSTPKFTHTLRSINRHVLKLFYRSTLPKYNRKTKSEALLQQACHVHVLCMRN